jgi:hypothetical protein
VTTPTKEQVIAAVEAEINPSTPGKMRIKPVALIALRRLVGKRRDQEWRLGLGRRQRFQEGHLLERLHDSDEDADYCAHHVDPSPECAASRSTQPRKIRDRRLSTPSPARVM